MGTGHYHGAVAPSCAVCALRFATTNVLHVARWFRFLALAAGIKGTELPSCRCTQPPDAHAAMTPCHMYRCLAFRNWEHVLAAAGVAAFAIELLLDGLPKHSAELDPSYFRTFAEVIR